MCYVKDNCLSSSLTLNERYHLFDEAIQAGALFFVLTEGELISHPFFGIFMFN